MDDRTRKYVERLDALNRRPLAERLEDDVSQYRDRSPQEIAATVEAVCETAWEIIKNRPDFERALAYRDQPAADFEAIWRALVRRRLEQLR